MTKVLDGTHWCARPTFLLLLFINSAEKKCSILVGSLNAWPLRKPSTTPKDWWTSS